MAAWEQIVENIELPEHNQKVYIWGAGNTSVLNHQGMVRENLYQELQVVAFIDSNLAGTIRNGLPVFHPKVLGEKKPYEQFVLISTTNDYVFLKLLNCYLRNEKKVTEEKENEKRNV